jgi:outer membrane protein assembly factor BamB
MMIRRAIFIALLCACGSSTPPARGTQATPSDPGHSVLQYHHSLARDGVYVEPALTLAAAAKVHRVTRFDAPVNGRVYGQPLFLEGSGAAPDQVIVASEENEVAAFDAQTGTARWRVTLGTPVPRSMLACGNIDPLGVTGTPVIDATRRTIYLDAMTTPDGTSARHLVFALDADSGAVRSGWPVSVNDAVAGFDSLMQNQRGALLLLDGRVYVPFGGHNGDCGTYYGWVVGISTSAPSDVQAFRTQANGGGIWAPGGLSSDGTSVFAATGNTFRATQWSGGEAILRLGAGPTFSGSAADFFAPTDWPALDSGDVDIGGSGPVLIDLANAVPAHAVIALGKNGKAYLLDRDALGGVSQAPVIAQASSAEIINGATAYTTLQGSFVAFAAPGNGCDGDLAALRIGQGTPPPLGVAWCATQNGSGSPIFTTTGDGENAMVWSVGAGGDNRLHAFDANTGTELFAGGGPDDAMADVQRYQTPIVAKERIYVAGNGALYAFEP